LPRFERDPDARGPIVRGFAPGGFSVDGQVYRGVFLTPNGAFDWAAPPVGELTAAEFEPLLAVQPLPEFIILGTGPRLAFPPRSLARSLEDRGVGLEVMDSRAAARIWGVLRGEDRWIAAGLMPLR
jgi:uncharacterized protein